MPLYYTHVGKLNYLNDNMPSRKIIDALKGVHKKHRLVEGSVSSHTKSAQKITKDWQLQVVSETVLSEVKVSPENSEKIDVVDLVSQTAYELKVSGKNTHHEFYKDVFKILTYNEYKKEKILRLVFISERDGIKSLERRLDTKLIALLKTAHNLKIQLEPI